MDLIELRYIKQVEPETQKMNGMYMIQKTYSLEEFFCFLNKSYPQSIEKEIFNMQEKIRKKIILDRTENLKLNYIKE